MNTQKNSLKSFTKLKVWQECRKLRKEISSLIKSFPKDEKYRLVDQLLCASRSVTANIAEGYGRFHYQENIQFCRQARGSLYEIIDHLTCAYDEDYINADRYKVLNDKITICIKLLNGFISYLKKAKQRKANEEEVIYKSASINQ
jgi:four helix bundle protein